MDKPITDFYERHIRLKKSNCCKKCWKEAINSWRNKDRVKNKEKYNARNRSWRKRNPDKVKTQFLKDLYGITLKEYNQRIIKQNGKCLICHKKSKLHIDHNHKTNKIRGLLCERCNPGLGFFNDDVNILKSAINYLTEEKEC